MKKIISLIASFFILSMSFAAHHEAKVIELHAAKLDDGTHWVGEKNKKDFNVHPGQKVKFVVKHELEGGFNFHGFKIKALDLTKQVNRNQPLELEVEIPKTMKPGKYPIECHFHAAHKGANLVVL